MHISLRDFFEIFPLMLGFIVKVFLFGVCVYFYAKFCVLAINGWIYFLGNVITSISSNIK